MNILLYLQPIRQGESDGREYYFVDEKRFGQLRDAGKVIEYRTYETVHGPWTYFTADDRRVDLAPPLSDNQTLNPCKKYRKEYMGRITRVPHFALGG